MKVDKPVNKTIAREWSRDSLDSQELARIRRKHEMQKEREDRYNSKKRLKQQLKNKTNKVSGGGFTLAELKRGNITFDDNGKRIARKTNIHPEKFPKFETDVTENKVVDQVAHKDLTLSSMLAKAVQKRLRETQVKGMEDFVKK